MNHESHSPDRHYRVIRYYPHPGHGVITEILDENLSLADAEECVRTHPPISHEEEIMIVDQNLQGLDSMVSMTHL